MNETIYAALARSLGREPTQAELKADVQRILREGREIAVNKAIAASGRAGRKIGPREARNIHRLLNGRY